RLRLDEVPVLTQRARAPVFHVFEELYASAVRELAAGADRDAAESAPYQLTAAGTSCDSPASQPPL
ncbi:MAG TPA: hypothetical protein VF904_19660, partial [Anaeromyxobacteraceae bacterium]